MATTSHTDDLLRCGSSVPSRSIPSIYEEVEADRAATGQALLVVVLSSVAAGIGARGLGGGSRREHRLHQRAGARVVGGVGAA